MVGALVRAAFFLGSAAIGLLVAKILISEMSISWTSFILVVIVFAVLQSLIAPLVAKLATKSAPALLGVAGLASTLLSLLITSFLFGGLTIDAGIGTWILAAVVVWVATLLATLVLPVAVSKVNKWTSETRSGGRASGEPGTEV